MLALIVAVVSSCSKDNDDDNPKFQDVTLTAGATQTLTVGKDLNWTSENDYIATVANGVISAKRVGEVRIASDKGSFKVKVNPQYTYFEEPCLNFGFTQQSVKNEMKAYTLVSEDNNTLTYKGTGYTTGILYSFENSALKYSYILTSSSYSTQVANWAAERYVYVTTSDNYIGMISVDKTILVVIVPMKVGNSWYYTIGYSKYDKNSSDVKAKGAPALMKKSSENYILKSDELFDDLRSKL